MKNIEELKKAYDKIIDRVKESKNKNQEYCPACGNGLIINFDFNEDGKILSISLECKNCNIRIRECDK